jgi:hypothetical protein
MAVSAFSTLNAAWYTPESWRQLEEAVAEAGLPPEMLVGSHADFVARFDILRSHYERQGVRVVKMPIDVPHMVAWCKRYGMPLNTASRAQYMAHMALGGDKL